MKGDTMGMESRKIIGLLGRGREKWPVQGDRSISGIDMRRILTALR
jgi:hypothetical protein